MLFKLLLRFCSFEKRQSGFKGLLPRLDHFAEYTQLCCQFFLANVVVFANQIEMSAPNIFGR